jgi:hypothetical protein
MKQQSEDDRFEAELRAEFGKQVIELYEATLAGNRSLESADDPDVRSVAYGLVALRQAVDHFFQQHRHNQLRLCEMGMYEADEILSALTTGTAHSIRRYLKSKATSSRPPPSKRENTIRSMLAGAVLAYEKIEGCQTRQDAAQAVSAGIKTADRNFSAGQLMKWIDRDEKGAIWFRDQFTADPFLNDNCGVRSERLLAIARQAMHPLLVVPN